MELHIEFDKDVSKRTEVGDKKERVKDRALGHTRSDERGLGPHGVKFNELCVAKEI